jgi:hypothetical protein
MIAVSPVLLHSQLRFQLSVQGKVDVLLVSFPRWQGCDRIHLARVPLQLSIQS